jgi:glyoxylase-like metal-dependent hydrolase (beta-lactamase superfamily II)
MTGFRTLKIATGIIAAFGLLSQASASAPEGTKLYIFSSGWLNIEKSALQSTAAPGRIKVPVSFYVIKHPKGNVLFETGNNDKIISDPTYWGPNVAALDPGRSPDVAIDAQLGKIGLKPSDINYVILGHAHLDHAGNVGKFPTSTLVYQRDEIVNAFWPKPGFAGSYIPGDLEPLRSGIGEGLPARQPVIELDGDLDLFGDGSIYIHRAPGHTPGSQLALLRLPKTGLVILTSDTVHLKENLDKNILPSLGLAYDPAGILNVYSYIRRVRDLERGDVIVTHDPDVFNAHKHAPEFYE